MKSCVKREEKASSPKETSDEDSGERDEGVVDLVDGDGLDEGGGGADEEEAELVGRGTGPRGRGEGGEERVGEHEGGGDEAERAGDRLAAARGPRDGPRGAPPAAPADLGEAVAPAERRDGEDARGPVGPARERERDVREAVDERPAQDLGRVGARARHHAHEAEVARQQREPDRREDERDRGWKQCGNAPRAAQGRYCSFRY